MYRFVVLLLLLFATPAFAVPRIVVSIGPIHSLVSSLTKGLSEPQLLITQGGSPHSSSLRPSQAQALTEADLFIWIGPELESFLRLPVARLVAESAELRLLSLENLLLLTQRQGGFWQASTESDHDQHDHSAQSINPHIWLSANNASLIATEIAKRLIKIDPQNQTSYRDNLARLQQRISKLQRRLTTKLKPIQGLPYLVFHDAYPYFEADFNLNAVGSIRVSAERAPGARRLIEIRAKISSSKALCLFSEPQFQPALAQILASDSGLKLGELDPLGSTQDNGVDGWFIMMENLAANLERCLSAAQ